ncbi:MAG: hypothetical protein PHE83_19150, partial [Opitutaceae bacterium]|nr:hypothetical protein [Opitutaceae bacterium]
MPVTMRNTCRALLAAFAFALVAGFGFADAPGDVAQKFVNALFERRYEDAYALTTKSESEEAAFARYDAWAANYFSPSDLKVLRMKEEKGGGRQTGNLIVLTFKYKNANGVDAIARAELIVAGASGAFKVEGI